MLLLTVHMSLRDCLYHIRLLHEREERENSSKFCFGLFAAAVNRNILGRLQIGRPSGFFFQGLWASFLCPSACGFFRYSRRFGVFFELAFHPDCIGQKRQCIPTAYWGEIFCPGENKLHLLKAGEYETIYFSVVLILDRAGL